MRAGPRLALLCLLTLAATLSPVAVGHAAAAPAAQSDDGNATVEPASTTLTVDLQADGDARWIVTTRFVLHNASDRRAFERLRQEYTTGDADATFDLETFEAAAAAGRNATGRRMVVEDPTFEGSTTEEGTVTVGRLRLTFRWTNFTERTGSQLVVGDAFNSTHGTWLPGLGQHQTLVIRPPTDYTLYDIPPGLGAEGGTVTVEGPATFEPGYLGRLTYSRGEPASSPGGTPDGGIDLSMLGLVGVVVIGLGALAVGAYVLAGRDDQEDVPAPGGEPNPNGGTDAATTPTDPDATPSGEPGGDEAGPDLDLLSDEERVEYLLQESGGRMKQATIVKETGWSNAKVSQLLSAMDDEGRIDKLRIGRENLISLPGEAVGEFDEE